MFLGDEGESCLDLLVVGLEIIDVTRGLTVPQAATVLAQIESVERAAVRGPPRAEFVVEEVVTPPVQIDDGEARLLRIGFLRAIAHQSGNDLALVILAKRHGAGLVAVT